MLLIYFFVIVVGKRLGTNDHLVLIGDAHRLLQLDERLVRGQVVHIHLIMSHFFVHFSFILVVISISRERYFVGVDAEFVLDHLGVN